jgi:HEAT repeat protein
MKPNKTLLLLILLSNFAGWHICAQTQATSPPKQDFPVVDPDAVVADVIQSTLKRGESTTSEGYHAYTWVSPSEEDVAKISDLGVKAIAPLSRYLDSPRPFVQLLAVRLLGKVGGAEAVEPLKRGLATDRWVVVRTQSLSSLIGTPDSLALPIIQSMRKDADPLVRKRAEDLLTSHYHLGLPSQ